MKNNNQYFRPSSSILKPRNIDWKGLREQKERREKAKPYPEEVVAWFMLLPFRIAGLLFAAFIEYWFIRIFIGIIFAKVK